MNGDLDSDDPQRLTAPVRGSGPGFPKATRRCLVATLLTLFGLQVIFTARQMSPGYDEVAILPSGYVFLKTGQWHLIAEHPPLIPALSALPLLALKPRLDLTDPSWTREPSLQGVMARPQGGPRGGD